VAIANSIVQEVSKDPGPTHFLYLMAVVEYCMLLKRMILKNSQVATGVVTEVVIMEMERLENLRENSFAVLFALWIFFLLFYFTTYSSPPRTTPTSPLPPPLLTLPFSSTTHPP
jgi:hypothetical protein